MNGLKSYLKFLLASYPVAFAFEFTADKMFDGQLFNQSNLPLELLIFLLWYGAFYSLAYFILKDRKMLWVVVYFAVIGSVAEIVVFHRSNLIVDPIVYALMGVIPFYVYRNFLNHDH
jgi:hypothetical protein